MCVAVSLAAGKRGPLRGRMAARSVTPVLTAQRKFACFLVTWCATVVDRGRRLMPESVTVRVAPHCVRAPLLCLAPGRRSESTWEAACCQSQ